MIRLQQEPFDLAREYAALKRDHAGIGGIAVFVGTVRGQSGVPGDTAIAAMTLEHYPAMTERALAAIDAEAHVRWPLMASLIIHRFGRLEPGDDIVLVMTAAAHRQPALEILRLPDRLAEDQGPVLEARGHCRRVQLGCRARRG